MTTGSDDQETAVAPDIEAQLEWKPGQPLEPQEQALLRHALAGTFLDLLGDERVDNQAMTDWGPKQTIRAVVLRHLLVEAQWPVHAKGVRVRGARISGPLDLESATLRCPLLLEVCYLDSHDPVGLDYTTAPQLTMSRCRVAGRVTAIRLMVTQDVDLSGVPG